MTSAARSRPGGCPPAGAGSGAVSHAPAAACAAPTALHAPIPPGPAGIAGANAPRTRCIRSSSSAWSVHGCWPSGRNAGIGSALCSAKSATCGGWAIVCARTPTRHRSWSSVERRTAQVSPERSRGVPAPRSTAVPATAMWRRCGAMPRSRASADPLAAKPPPPIPGAGMGEAVVSAAAGPARRHLAASRPAR